MLAPHNGFDLEDWVCRTRLSTNSSGIRHEACSVSIRHESPNISETRSICGIYLLTVDDAIFTAAANYDNGVSVTLEGLDP
jgi:hypothetical protein